LLEIHRASGVISDRRKSAGVAVASGDFTMSGIVSDGGSAYGLTKTGTGQLVMSGANTFTGGLAIKAGTVRGDTSANAYGANASVITLGDTSGSTAATLAGNYAGPFANPITVASGSSGTLTITENNNSPAFSGAVTLNNNLTVSNSNCCANVTLSGGITGTGNVVLNNTSSSSIVVSTNPVNMTGTITSTSSSGGVSISSVIGTNVTGVVQNGTGSTMTLSGTNTFTSGLAIKAGTVIGQTSANAFGANTSTITLGNTSGSASATLTGNYNGTFANPISVASGNSGTMTISQGATGPSTFSGAVTLSHDLTLYSNGCCGDYLTLSGGITGTGNLTLNTDYGATYITLSTNPVKVTLRSW
jgi:fibronectin-binding autotransporter adhesin